MHLRVPKNLRLSASGTKQSLIFSPEQQLFSRSMSAFLHAHRSVLSAYHASKLVSYLALSNTVRYQTATAQSTASETAETSSKSRSTPRYSPLHYNIEDFCRRVVPTEEEKRLKHAVVEAITQATRRTFAGEPFEKRIKVETFGSFASGLSTWNSDVDLVILGVAEPDRVTGAYERGDRSYVLSCLSRLASTLRKSKRLELSRLQIVRFARMPIIKIRSASRVCVDISISDESGPRAARFITQQLRAYPTMGPLVLVIKALLSRAKLNEVAHGGLSSYSVNNMVIAHLQEELKAGHDIYDLGETLYSFLLRFGEDFNYTEFAVSVASGGVVRKRDLGLSDVRTVSRNDAMELGSSPLRLCVDDPLTGRDIALGTWRVDLVKELFITSARKLEALARGRSMSDKSTNYLTALFDVEKMCLRHFELEDDERVPENKREEDMAQGLGGDDFTAREEYDDDMELTPTVGQNVAGRGR